MQIVLVGRRRDQAVINWPGVVVRTILVTAGGLGGTVLVWLLLDGSFLLLPFLLVTIPLLLLFLVVMSVKSALKRHPSQLPPLT